jgi:hypothetical protein
VLSENDSVPRSVLVPLGWYRRKPIRRVSVLEMPRTLKPVFRAMAVSVLDRPVSLLVKSSSAVTG